MTNKIRSLSSSPEGYTAILNAFDLDALATNVIWALLFDCADVIKAKTSSRQIAKHLGMHDRTVGRCLSRLVDMQLIEGEGRSLTDIRYSLDRDRLVQMCHDKARPLNECFVCNPAFDAIAASVQCLDERFPDTPAWLNLLCKLGYDYVRTAVLLALIRQMNDEDDVLTMSCRDIERDTAIPRQTVHRSLNHLEGLGLISASERRSSYVVNTSVLRAVLSTPFPHVRVLPGITSLDALQRLFPVSPDSNEGGIH